MKTLKKILVGIFFILAAAIGIYNVYVRSSNQWDYYLRSK